MKCTRTFAFPVLAFALFAASGGLRGQPPAADVLLSFKGHTDTVESVAISPDGTLVATASFDRNVRLFDLATGNLVRTYGGEQLGHKGQVLAVTFSAKGDQIATGAADNTARIWDVPVNFPVKTFATAGAATRVFVSPTDGKTFAVAGADGVVKIFPAGEEKGAIELKGHTGAVTRLGQSGAAWVTGGADKTIRFWDATGKQTGSYSFPTADLTGLAVSSAVFSTHSDGVLRTWQIPPQPTRAFPALKAAVTAFAAGNDGNTILYATADKVVTLGTVSNNTAAGTFAGAKGAVEVVSLSPDSATVYAGCGDGSVILWDRQGKVKGELTAHAGGVTAVAVHPAQPLLITAGADGLVKGWVLPVDPKQPKDKAVKTEIKAHAGKVLAAVTNPATGQVITTGGDKLVRFWDVTKPEKPVKEIGPLAAPVPVLALSRDGTLLAGAAGKDVFLWTTADGKDAGKFTQSADVTSLNFNADKTRLLIGRTDNAAVLVDAKDGTPIQSFGHTAAVKGVLALPTTVVTASADKTVVVTPIGVTRAVPVGKAAGLVLSPDNQRLVTVGPGKECVSWLAGNGTKDKSFETGGDATAAAFSKDSQRLAVGGADGSVKLYTVGDGKMIGAFAAGGPVSELAFHPVAPQLVGTVKNAATVWNVAFTPGQPLPPEFGRQLQSFPHPKGLASPVFSADGHFYTAGDDKMARRFRIASDAPVKNFAHPNLVDCVAFDDTGNRLATGCHDGILRIWDVPKNTPLKTINAHIVTTPQNIQSPIYSIVWSPDFKQVFTSSYDKTIKLWDAASGNMVREFKAAPAPTPIVEVKKDDKDKKTPPKAEPKKDTGPVGHRDQVFSIALTKDGKLLASGSSDKTVKLWDVTTGKVVRDFENPDIKPVFPGEPAPSHPGWVQSVRFTPDLQFLVTAGPAPKGKSYVAVWKVADGKRVFGAERESGPIHSMAVSADGTKLILGCAPPRGKTEPEALVVKLPK